MTGNGQDGSLADRTDLLAESRELIELLLNDKRAQELIRSLCGGLIDPDDLVQNVALRLQQRFVNAKKSGEPTPVVKTNQWAYLRTAIKHTAFDELSRNKNAPIPTGRLDDLAIGSSDVTSDHSEAKADTVTSRIVEQSFAGPTLLGQAFEEQRSVGKGRRASRQLARRCAAACLVVAWQRRSSSLLTPMMFDVLGSPLDSGDDSGRGDEIAWLREAVNRALGVLIEGWSDRYSSAPPQSNSYHAGVRRGTEREDYSFLREECSGRADKRRDDGESQQDLASRFGVAALLRIVWEPTVVAILRENRS